MSEAVREKYKKKVVSVEEALKHVKSDCDVISALAAAEPKLFMKNLHTIADKVKDVNVYTCLPMGKYDFFTNPEYKENFKHHAWFYTPLVMGAPYEMNSYVPNHLHMAGTDRLANRPPRIFAGTATPPDKNGYMSLSLSATYEVDMLEQADIVILEVNEKFPRTFGDTIIQLDQVDYIIEADYDVPEIPIPPTSEKDKKIAEYIAEYLENGNTLQLGIGGIPNAVGSALTHLKDIGIHTEMITAGMADLFEAGVITGRRKSLMNGKMIAAFALGNKKLYDFLHDNPGVSIMRGKWVNDPFVIGQNYKQVSINTSVEVDLTGQVCSESIGTRQISGTGGQADTAIGAQRSAGGKSFIALYSTANIKDPATGEKKPASKIVPTLKQGAAVTLHRSNVDYVVTENGCVRLKGLSIRERAKKLISIAHKDFQDELLEEAKKLKFI
jgi:acyl-CoA hydrolase